MAMVICHQRSDDQILIPKKSTKIEHRYALRTYLNILVAPIAVCVNQTL